MLEGKKAGFKGSRIQGFKFLLASCILQLAAVFLLPAFVHASENPPTTPLEKGGKGGLWVKAEVDKKEVLIGGQIIYTLYVTADKNLDIELPLDRPDFTPFDFIGQRGIEKKEDKGKAAYKIDYVLVAYEVGELETPPQTVFFRDAKGKESEVSSGKIKIIVKGVAPKPAKDIKPLKEPVGVEIKKGIGAGWIFLGLLIVMAIIILSAFIYMKNIMQQKPILKPALSPKDIALLELDNIQAMGLIEKGDLKRFHALIGDCIKRFVSNGIHIPPSGLTTEEILERVQGFKGSRVQEILRDCNIVEFAGYLPTDVESMDIMERARKAVISG